MPLPRYDTGEDCFHTMDLRTGLYNHPYASMVTAVFLISLLVTALYALGLLPGAGTTQSEYSRLLLITGVLFVATAASWLAALALSADGR